MPSLPLDIIEVRNVKKMAHLDWMEFLHFYSLAVVQYDHNYMGVFNDRYDVGQ